MLEEFSLLSRQPEYLHVLLHGFPVYGTVLGGLALFLALVLRQRSAQIVALSVVFVSAICIWPVEEFGEQAEDRVETMVDGPGRQWIEAHKERAEKVVPVFFVLSAVSALALLVPLKFPKSATPLAGGTLVLCLGCIVLAGWVSRAGGQIRHREFRTGAPPPVRAENAPD